MGKKDILIVGDYSEDVFVFVKDWRRGLPFHRLVSQPHYGFTVVRAPGDHLALAAYLKKRLEKNRPDLEVSYLERPIANKDEPIAENLSIVRPFPVENNEFRWRIERSCMAGEEDGSKLKFACQEINESDWKSRDAFVIMDFDKGWRKQHGGNLPALIGGRRHLVRTHDPTNPDWRPLLEAYKKDMKKAEDGLWLCLSEDLAKGGLRAPGDWEHQRRLIIRWLKTPPNGPKAERCSLWDKKWIANMVIRIGYDGVLTIKAGDSDDGTLLVERGAQPGSFIREQHGHVTGSGIAFVGSFVELLTAKNNISTVLQDHAKTGLVVSREVLKQGYEHPTNSRWDTPDSDEFKQTTLLKVGDLENLNTLSVIQYRETYQWDWSCVEQIVSCHKDTVPEYTTFKLGKLFVFSSQFAKQLLIFMERLEKYANDRIQELLGLESTVSENTDHKPTKHKVLSFAVFGTPGSGKSFAAKQLMKNVNASRNTVDAFATRPVFKEVICNLSTFGGDRNLLIEKFKEIDAITSSGEIPFVIWDEFDTYHNDKQCGWVSEFLMPMEDAMYTVRGEQSNFHGPCVFAFVGGTFDTATEFERWAMRDEVRPQKARDFCSRLESSIDLPPINPDMNCEDYSLDIVTEAKLVRAAIIRKELQDHTNLTFLHKDVLIFLTHVFLKHGARSLTKILEASTLQNTDTFYLWHLPSESVLEAHLTDNKSYMSLTGRSQFAKSIQDSSKYPPQELISLEFESRK